MTPEVSAATIPVRVQFVDPDEAENDPQAKVQTRMCHVAPDALWEFLEKWDFDD